MPGEQSDPCNHNQTVVPQLSDTDLSTIFTRSRPALQFFCLPAFFYFSWVITITCWSTP